ncbi:MAG: 23S rRNA (uracil(1939)-C(5))-methyltransferase RlmD [Dissulfurimicrobium sp.]|uniref:23S rRNA (uracil(1939)-C(5))-methyltransferase RlmD n=1 Tax=Dissulfurimicrobium sp. TaxID=2022436 RepID=UPI00404B3438
MSRRRKNRQDQKIFGEADIESLSHDGRGIARVDGKIVFIEGALPSERVRFKYKKRRASFNEAQTVEVLSPSPERTEPLCPHFGVCGGCSLQHMAHGMQIRIKEQALLEHLRHFGKIEPANVLPPLIGPLWGYRRSARIGVKYVEKKAKVLVGFREKQSGFIADIDSCAVLDSRVGGLISELKVLISGLKAFRTIPQIEVSAGDETAALIFRNLQGLADEDLEALKAFGDMHGIHIYLQPGGPETIVSLWPETQKGLSYRLPEFDIEISFRPGDFIQINGALNRSMVSEAVKSLALTPGDAVLDLFCGLGNFSLPIARVAASVTGVEGSAAMSLRAIANAGLNGIKNAAFYTADLASDFSNAPWADKRPDKVLLDPPRSGAINVVRHLTEIRPERIVYVSCNPATLARDIGVLIHTGGYRLKSVRVIDMFPHTSHVEVMAVLETS